MKLNKGNWVGQAVRRKEDFALLTGHARFMDDLEPVVGLRHAAVLRSPHGHAELVSLDISRAAALPGVVGVLTGKDVVAMGKPIGNLFTDKAPYYPCAVDRVRYYGEPVAVVIAEDRYVAEDALDLIDVVYKPMPAVIDPEAALAADAPVLHDKLGTNKVHHRLFRYGDPEHAFSEAEHVARVKVRYPRVNSTPIETYGVVAHFEPVPDRYTVWSNFQGPFAMHAVLCDALRTPTSRVRMITAPASGGSFGIKQAIYPYIVLMALASRRFGVPVKWIEDRLEHLAASSASSERVTEIEGAFRRDGTLLALRLKQTENVGAYLRPPEPAGLYRMHATLNSAYKVQHFAIENTAVVTNQMPSGLNRGFGAPQYIYPLERLLDVAASDLGLNGETIRRQNFIPKSRMPYECPAGSVIDGGDYQAALDLALDTIDIKDIMLRRDRARANGRLYGIGIACAIETSGSNLAYVNLGQTPVEREQGLPKSGAAAVAVLRMDPLGNITVHIDSTPSGQGHETMVAQVVADTLGVTPDDVDVITPMDTGSFPWTVNAGNYSNRFTACVVPAVKLAADRAAHKLRVIAQREFDMPLDKIKFRKGKVYVRGARNFEMPIRRLAAQLHWDSGNLPDGMDAGLSEQVVFSPNKYPAPDNTDRVRSSLNYAFQVDVAAVEIDRDSGEVRIDKYATVHDIGNQLNPKLVEGQIWGGFAHGIGAALSEKVAYAPDGTLLSGTFADYLCPTAAEMPPLQIAHISTPTDNNVFGAKGVGDGSSMVAPSTIGNAIADALSKRDLTPPFTPNRIWSLLNNVPEATTAAPAPPAADEVPLAGGPYNLRGQGEAFFDASPKSVWRYLFDPPTLRELIPGCDEFAETTPHSYRAEVTMKIAGIGGTYGARIDIRDRDEPRSARLFGRVDGKRGGGQGEARIELSAIDDGRTRLVYTYQARVTGPLASLGHRLIEGILKLLARQFFRNLNARVPAEARPGKASPGLFSRLFGRGNGDKK